jgi:hypothetical protein
MKFLKNAFNKNEKENEKEKEKENTLFQNMNNLPTELCNLIQSFVSSVLYIGLNKEYYFLYHHLFYNLINKRQLETYIRTMIRQDNDFVFVQLLRENHKWWLKMTNYIYRDSIYAHYLVFLQAYCLENDSFKCKRTINDLFVNLGLKKELGLSKNQHKKNITRNIIWKV